MADADIIDVEGTNDALFVFIVVRQHSFILVMPDIAITSKCLFMWGIMILFSFTAGNTSAQSASVRSEQGGQGHMDEPPESA